MPRNGFNLPAKPLMALLLSWLCLSMGLPTSVQAQQPVRLAPAVGGPDITIWYGDAQTFGEQGVAQRWVNVLGNVTDTDGVDSLYYTLNGGSKVMLTIGSDGKRLQSSGDFNVDLATNDLLDGVNEVIVAATDNLDNRTEDTVTVNYTSTNVWPLPYAIDWQAPIPANEVSQAVDGHWEVTSDGLHTVTAGYDRLVAIGDTTWDDYEITVPVTIHSAGGGSGVGVLLRWMGHTDVPVTCAQPKCGYLPLGAICWYRGNRIEIYGNDGDILATQSRSLTLDTTYIFKARVETNPGVGGQYSLKVWKQSETEPAGWDITAQEALSDPQNGSLMLISHQADVTYGNLTVTDIPISITNVQALVQSGDTSATISWNTSAPASSQVEYGLTPAYELGTVTDPTLKTSHSLILASLLQDTAYHYRISSVSGAGDTAFTGDLLFTTVASDIVSDDFHLPLLNTSLWTFVDPVGDCDYDLVGSNTDDAWLNFQVPAGTEHQLWTTGLKVPHVRQSCNNTDFEVEAKFESPLTLQYQEQGILVRQDDDTFMRFEFFCNSTETMVYVATIVSGAATTHADVVIGANGMTPLYMRVKRQSDQWTVSHSTDGASWSQSAIFNFALTVTGIGPYAGNAVGGSSPAHTGSIDYFFNTASPVDPEDPVSGGVVTITSAPVTAAVIGQLYGYDVEATGTPAPTYSLLTAPAGMTIDGGSGLIEWTPNATGDFDVSVQASNSVPAMDVQDFVIHVADTAGGATSDDFNDSTLDAAVWTFVDPLGGGGYTLTGTCTDDAWINISVPAGAEHQLWESGILAPHIAQPSGDTDFELEVKFESSVSGTIQEQGILVKQDDANFMRFEFFSVGSNTNVFAATLTGLVPPLSSDIKINTSISASVIAPLYMRVNRTGNQWTQSYSTDGIIWDTATTFAHTLVVTGVGTYAGNASASPAHTSSVDYFFNTSSPITPEDAVCPWTITPSAGLNGSITPDTAVVVADGGSQAFTITPDPGYHVLDVVTDTGSVGAVTTFTFTNVTADHSIAASFEIDPVTWTITPSAGLNGSISPDAAVVVADGGSQAFTITPDPGWHVLDVVTDTGSVGAVTSYTFTNVTANHTIAVSFEIDPAVGGPDIIVWYGDEQSFGQQGVAQRWVNVLGNVTDTDGVDSLYYTLNGGSKVMLTIGSDGRRLQSSGDFNVDLATNDLLDGVNEVIVAATDNLNNRTEDTVTVNYTSTNVWPLPYAIDWQAPSAVNEVSQAVDGHWEVTSDGLHTVTTGYDRLVAIGDTTWGDYEITVPVTIHSTGGGSGVGVLLRWMGHTDTPVTCAQPKCGYLPLGAICWYRGNRIEIFGNGGDILATQTRSLSLDTTYLFKARVETNPGVGGQYSFKVWKQSETEPAGWDITGQEALSDPQNGSLMLISHYGDVTYGNLTVTTDSPISITNVQALVHGGDTSATISWNTSAPASSQVEYGLTSAYELGTVTDPTLKTSHSLILASLLQDTAYHYRISSVSGAGDTAFTGDLLFTTVASDIVSDDFNDSTLNASVWSFVDPLGGGGYTLTGTCTDDAWINISVPSGTAHEVWTAGIQAPHILQDASDSDFELEVKFESSLSSAFQEQGILVKQDDANFIRFEFFSGGSNTTVFAATLTGVAPPLASSIEISSDIGGTGIAPLYMRVNRTGNQWTQSYSTDGTIWTMAGSFAHTMAVAEVGTYAGNAGASPAHTSSVDYFYNTSSPVTPEDAPCTGTYQLTVSTSAGGTITAPPTSPVTVDAGVATTITAAADPGYTFTGWTVETGTGVTIATPGALSTTATLTAGDAEVQANFTLDTYQLTVSTTVGGSITAPGTSPVTVGHGVAETITAVADPGYAFTGWTVVTGTGVAIATPGALSTTATLTAGDAEVQATFSVNTFQLTVSSTVGGFITVPPTSPVTVGDGVATPITAMADADYTFTGWTVVTGTGVTIATPGALSTTATLTAGDAEVRANFVSGMISSDDFNDSTLNTAVWSFIDPLGGGGYTISGTCTDDAWINISVPSGSPHELWTNGIMAPHIVQPSGDTDFELEVKFESSLSGAFQEQGILVKQDSANFARFEFFSDASNTKVIAATLTAGPGPVFPLTDAIEINTSIGATGIAPLYMRVNRTGNQWTQSYSTDGTIWTTAVSFAYTMVVTGVGTYAGNAGASPAHTSSVDYFFNTVSPVTPEDGSCTEVPMIVSTAVTAGTVGQLYSYDVDATGLPTPTYGLLTAPAGMIINVSSGLIEWTPAAVGSYPVSVTATNTEGADTQSFSIEVAGPPDIPTLILPLDASVTNNDTPTFEWSSTAGVGGQYTLEYALDAAFTVGLVAVTGLTDTTYTVPAGLTDATYYWHVEAIDAGSLASGYQASPFSFTLSTVPPAVPTLLTPADLSTINDNTPTMTWSATAGPGGNYTLEYAEDAAFTVGLMTMTGLTDTTYTVPASLADDTYYWHVEAIDAGSLASGYQASPFSFTLSTVPPAVPTLLTPPHLSFTSETQPTFTWTGAMPAATDDDRSGTSADATAVATYTLEYSMDPSFTTATTVSGLSDTTYTVPGGSPLTLDTWYWHVESVDDAGNHSGYQVTPSQFGVFLAGDANGDGAVTSADIIILVNYVFKGGVDPIPCKAAGDINCDGSVTSADIIALVNYVFKGGSLPCNVGALIAGGTWDCP